LRTAIGQLPQEQRIVVERRIHHHETFAQIAEQLDVPLGTVLTRMRIATQSLRKSLHED
jgi:DNA-directed RNA polymerase specialized sigma24 family protein